MGSTPHPVDLAENSRFYPDYSNSNPEYASPFDANQTPTQSSNTRRLSVSKCFEVFSPRRRITITLPLSDARKLEIQENISAFQAKCSSSRSLRFNGKGWEETSESFKNLAYRR
jgi:hypothetical protein